MKRKQGARAYRKRSDPERKTIVAQAVKDLAHGIPVTTIAAQYGIKGSTLSYWLRDNIDAYHNRLSFITNSQLARDPDANAFLRRRRLERLVTYRRLNGLPPNPSPKRKVDPNDQNDQSNQRVK